MEDRASLKGKNAIITGARRGIGRSIAEEFARRGANIWVCARKADDDFTEDMRSLSQKYSVDIEPVFFDLADREGTKAAVQGIIKEKRPIDILVNNAGVSFGGLLNMTSMEKLKDVFEINFFAQIQMIQFVSRVMMKQKSGSIVNMASIGGIETAEGYLAYGSSKAALIYATKSISRELGEYGIRVNAVAPGLTDTEMGGYKPEEEINKIIARSSLHRIAQPYEIAGCVAFLASDEASFITGQVLIADGGRICS